MNNKEVCYFIPMGYLNEFSGEGSYKQMLASLVFSFLFEGQIIIADSILANTYYLRKALRENETFNNLIKHKKISIATRTINDKFYHFNSTAQDIFSNKGVSYSFPDNGVFLDFCDLENLYDYCNKIPYSVEEAKDYYTNGLENTYKSQAVRKLLPNGVKNIILEQIYLKKLEEGHVRSSFFERKSGIGEALEMKLKDSTIWSKYGKIIFNASIANYNTFLPTKFNANPVYGLELAQAFDIWYGRTELNKDPISDVLTLRSNLDPVNFIEGLLVLDIDDLLEIVNSSESNNLQSIIGNFTYGIYSTQEVKYAFEAYKNLIDYYIIKKIGLITNKQHTFKIKMHRLQKILGGGSEVIEFICTQVLDVFTFGSSSVAKLSFDVFRKLSTPEERMKGIVEKSEWIDKLQKITSGSSGESELIQQRKRIFQSGRQDTLLTFNNIF